MKNRIKSLLKSFFLDFRRTLFALRIERARRLSESLRKNPLHWKAGEVLLLREMMKKSNDSLPTAEEINERFRRLSYPPPSPDSFPPKPPFEEIQVQKAAFILRRISPRTKEQEDLLREIDLYQGDPEAEIHFTFPFPDPPEGIFLDSIRITRDGKTFVFIGEEQQ
jgi:hypothetical protein